MENLEDMMDMSNAQAVNGSSTELSANKTEGEVKETMNNVQEEQLEKTRTAKREAAQRMRDRRNEYVKNVTELCGSLSKKLQEQYPEVWKSLSPDEQQLLIKYSVIPNNRATSQTLVLFHKLFGDEPKIGATITVQDAILKTLKGKAELIKLFKNLKEKHSIIVEYDEDTMQFMLVSVKE